MASQDSVKILSAQELPLFVFSSSASTPYPACSPAVLQELMDNAGARAVQCVNEARKILMEAGLNVLENTLTPSGNVRALILDEAKEWGADIIVLGSHGRRGLERLLMGSVSETVAIYAHCSVEVIRL